MKRRTICETTGRRMAVRPLLLFGLRQFRLDGTRRKNPIANTASGSDSHMKKVGKITDARFSPRREILKRSAVAYRPPRRWPIRVERLAAEGETDMGKEWELARTTENAPDERPALYRRSVLFPTVIRPPILSRAETLRNSPGAKASASRLNRARRRTEFCRNSSAILLTARPNSPEALFKHTMASTQYEIVGLRQPNSECRKERTRQTCLSNCCRADRRRNCAGAGGKPQIPTGTPNGERSTAEDFPIKHGDVFGRMRMNGKG